MILTKKLKADDIELDPKNADHKNWDVLVAVAKFLRAHFDGSKPTDDRCNLQVANQGVKRKTTSINDQEENIQKHVTRKRRCYSNAGFEEDYFSQGEEECGNYNSKKKKKRCRGRSENKKGGKKVIELPYPPPNMPTKFMNKILEMGGTDIKLVIQKALSRSDCKKDQNRLFISVLDAADFLNENEKELLQIDAGDKQSIAVVLLPPDLKETDITLRQYNLQKTKGKVNRQYVLNQPWYKVVVRNGLVENTIIQIWSFRVDGKLGLAIVDSQKAKNTRNEGSDETSTTSTDGELLLS